MNAAERQRPRAGELCLDHLAHFVPDLGAAAAVWEKLGLAVTPVSNHDVSGKPTGTANRCVMLEEGYIELLAPSGDNGVSTPHSRRVHELMRRYDGVHLACFGTPDAAAEQQRLADHGFEPEPLVNLQRTVEGGALARFNVIYVAPGKMPEGRVQYCEHLTPEHVWQKKYVNQGVRLSAVYVAAENPAQAAARWARFTGLIPRSKDDLVELECARGRVAFGTSRSLSRILGSAPPAPALAGYSLSVRDATAILRQCEKAGLKVKGDAVTLPAALGGAWQLVTGPQ